MQEAQISPLPPPQQGLRPIKWNRKAALYMVIPFTIWFLPHLVSTTWSDGFRNGIEGFCEMIGNDMPHIGPICSHFQRHLPKEFDVLNPTPPSTTTLEKQIQVSFPLTSVPPPWYTNHYIAVGPGWQSYYPYQIYIRPQDHLHFHNHDHYAHRLLYLKDNQVEAVAELQPGQEYTFIVPEGGAKHVVVSESEPDRVQIPLQWDQPPPS